MPFLNLKLFSVIKKLFVCKSIISSSIWWLWSWLRVSSFFLKTSLIKFSSWLKFLLFPNPSILLRLRLWFNEWPCSILEFSSYLRLVLFSLILTIFWSLWKSSLLLFSLPRDVNSLLILLYYLLHNTNDCSSITNESLLYDWML